MSGPPARELSILVAAVAFALAVPLAAAHHLNQRISRGLQPALSNALGAAVSVGSVEASLTGAVRLERVTVGNAFYAEAIEASVALENLLSGNLRADEIRIEQPRMRIHLDEQGHSNLERIARNASEARARSRGAAPATGEASGRYPRIVVSDGDLTVQVGGSGEFHLADVQLHPRVGGLRVVVGEAAIDLGTGAWTVDGRFARAAGDLSFPDIRFERVLAVGGKLTVRPSRGKPTVLSEAVLARRAGNGPDFRFTAHVDGAGSASSLTAIAPTDEPTGKRLILTAQHLPLSAFSPLLPASVNLDRALGSGRTVLTQTDHGDLGLQVDAQLSGVVVADSRVSRLPVEWDGHAAGSAVVRGERSDRQIELENLEMTTGDLRARLSGRLDWPSRDSWPQSGELSFAVPRTDCMRALTSLPTPLRDKLSGLSVRGQLSLDAGVEFDLHPPEATHLRLAVDVGDCRVVAEASHADPRTLEHPFEHTFPNGETRVVGYGEGDYAILRSLPAYVDGAFVASEDAKFFTHHGFDQRQIENSLAVNLQRRAIVRGGSTISQQLVKNVFLAQERTVSRKLQEAVLTWRLETTLGKRLILERYLNIIELGVGVYGISAAARYWFGKSPSDLDVVEAAFLAALAPAPRTTSTRIRRAGGIDETTRSRVNEVLQHMRDADVIDDATYRRALATELDLRAPLMANR